MQAELVPGCVGEDKKHTPLEKGNIFVVNKDFK